MSSVPSLNGFSDESSCGGSAGPVTPECGPLVHPILIEDGVGIRLEHFWDRKKMSFDSASAPATEASTGDTSVTTPSSGSHRDGPIRNVCFIGAGYVGGPTAAVIALHNPHLRVEVLDRDDGRIKRWNSGHLPIHEPGLGDVVRVARDGAQATLRNEEASADASFVERRPNLIFTTDSQGSLSRADVIFLAVNTPTKNFGVGAGRATNMSALDGAVQSIATYARSGAIIVEKSTVPCGTARRVRNKLRALRPEAHFDILSNPEFLAEGTAIPNLMSPDRVLIGCSNTPSGRRAASALADVYGAWVPRGRIIESNVWSSELTKLVANAMLAQRISSINSVSAICEKTGADVDEIARSIGRDPRIGPLFLKAGLGFGGSCFRKDISSLVYLAESLGLDDVADYWRSVNSINERQRLRFAQKVIRKLDENLVNKKITLLGFAFKKDTGDARESLAVDVIKTLLEEMPAELAIFDPLCKTPDIQYELKALENNDRVKIYDDPYQACADAHAVLILTDHHQFRPLYPEQEAAICKSLPPAAMVIDEETSSQRETFVVNEVSFELSQQPECLAGPAKCPDCLGIANNESERLSEYSDHRLCWDRVLSSLREPRYIFDSRGVLDAKRMEAFGFEASIESIGKGKTFADEYDTSAKKHSLSEWEQ